MILKTVVIRRKAARPRAGKSFARLLWAFCAFCFGMGTLHALGNADAGAALIGAGISAFCLWHAVAR